MDNRGNPYRHYNEIVSNESTLLVVRKNVLVRHPYTAGAVWFCLLAALAALAFRTVFGMAGGGDFVGPAAASAILPGMLIGRQIVDGRLTNSIWGAARRGAVIVLISHLLLPIFLSGGQLFSWKFCGEAAFLVLFSLIFAGWVTVSVGTAGAILLYKLRDLRSGTPKGCAVHGYLG
ncbi:MAG TPA: hypothetical protein V6D22_23460 [Candidatus Obscuribacterales bacterium]